MLGLIEDDERVMVVAASGLSTTPISGDIVEVGNSSYRVKRVDEVNPLNVPMIYKLYVLS